MGNVGGGGEGRGGGGWGPGPYIPRGRHMSDNKNWRVFFFCTFRAGGAGLGWLAGTLQRVRAGFFRRETFKNEKKKKAKTKTKTEKKKEQSKATRASEES